MKKRIIVDCISLKDGGGQTHIIELKKYFDTSLSFEYVYLVNSNLREFLRFEDPNNVQIIHPIFYTKIGYIFWNFYFCKFYFRKKLGDLLFVPGGSYFGDLPSVVMCRNMLPYDRKALKSMGVFKNYFRYRLLRLIQLHSFKKAKAVVFLNEYAMNSVFTYTNKINKSFVVPHGISDSFLFFNRKQNVVNIGSDALFNFVYVSTISEYKNHRFLVILLLRLKEIGYNVHCDFIGRYNYSDYQLFLKEFPDLAKVATFRGKVNYYDLPRLLSNYDAAFFVSTCENMPNILLEKIKNGIPVITFNIEPMSIYQSRNSIFLDFNSLEASISSMIDFFQNPDDRIKVINENIELTSKFTWNRTFSEMEKIFSKIIIN